MIFNPGSALTPSHDDPLEDSVLIRLTETASARVGCVATLEALAVVLGVICGYIRKRSVAHDGEAPITRECLAAHALFYGFLFVGILFSWNWFNLLSPEFTAVGTDTSDLVWGFINAALPLLAGTLDLALLRGDT